MKRHDEVNYKVDDELKKNTGDEEERITFEEAADPFYSELNIQYLKKLISDVDFGKKKLVEHELIET